MEHIGGRGELNDVYWAAAEAITDAFLPSSPRWSSFVAAAAPPLSFLAVRSTCVICRIAPHAPKQRQHARFRVVAHDVACFELSVYDERFTRTCSISAVCPRSVCSTIVLLHDIVSHVHFAGHTGSTLMHHLNFDLINKCAHHVPKGLGAES